MKKTIYLLVIFLISLNAITFAKSHDIIENISVDEEILYTYWTNYKSQIRPFGEEREPTNAFVADIDNDKEPELIVFFSYLGPGGPTFSVYKNDKGNIYLDGHIMTGSGTGIHHDLKLFLENCGALKVVDHYFCYPYYELGTQSVTLSRYESKSTVIEKYAEANYMDEIYYTTSVSGENKKYCTRQEADEFIDDFIDDFYSNINHNVVFSSEPEDKTDIDFFEIWNMQKQLRKTVNVLLDNKEISFDQPPIIVDGRTLVPLRAIFEELGATVNWDGNTQTVTSTKGQTTISMSIGKNEMYKNGKLITLDVAPQLVGGRTLVPVRAVAEGFDCKVDWDSDNNMVIINSKHEYKTDGYKTIAAEIEENNIKEHVNLNMREWTPLKGLTEAMLNTGDLSDDTAETLADAFEFITTWIGNAVEITKLDVTVGKDNQISIKYGESIEKNRSGAEMSLGMMLQEKLYNVSPSIIFTQDKLADEYIRNWFGLDGEGTYSMIFDFGKIEYGAYGYYLLIEGDKVYQVPIIHPDTTMNVYYKDGKKKEFVMDAADILRKAKLEMYADEKEKVLRKLRDNGYCFK